MSTRGSLYYHRDEETGVTIHIYDECSPADTPTGLRIEIEHPYGDANVAWPGSKSTTELLKDGSA